MSRNWTPETFTVLRNCRLLDGATLDGVSFVRCLPRPYTYNADGADGWKLTPEATRAMARRVVEDVGEEGVFVANNPEFGGDYVRVNTDTATYRYICHLKS